MEKMVSGHANSQLTGYSEIGGVKRTFSMPMQEQGCSAGAIGDTTVTSALFCAHETVTRLTDAVSALEERLAPALSSDFAPRQGINQAQASRPVLVENVDALIARLSVCVDHVSEIASRVRL